MTEYARESFGIKYLYPYQRLVVANVMDAMATEDPELAINQVVILPTGAGKSLCFQLPAALCPGPTLVVYPLLGLMADQERRLASTGIGLVVIKGGMTVAERETAFQSIRSGKARIVITNPEVLAVPSVLKILAGTGVFHFVIDEAHCVAEWGDSFRPAYLGLGAAIKTIAPRIVTAFTATASPPILERVTEVLFGNKPYRLLAGAPDRANIHYEVQPALSMVRAIRLAVSSQQKPMIIFVASRSGVEILAEDLRAAIPGIDTRFYHAGLEKTERTVLEQWFMESNDGVLCSTCAYGMGMDKPNIRTVIHFGIPASVEAYLQESGRAGRDGKPSTAILLRKAVSEDYGISVKKTPLKSDLQDSRKDQIMSARAHAMFTYATGRYGCRRKFLLQALGADEAASIACSGCDDCDGTSERFGSGSREISAVVAQHARRFKPLELAAFMSGKPGSEIAASRGVLREWQLDEVEEAVINARATGFLEVGVRHPWKGRVIRRNVTSPDFIRVIHRLPLDHQKQP